jgi:hypothetical protein
MNAEQIVQNCIGQPCKNIRVSMVNINSLPMEGNSEKSQPSCKHFVDYSSKLFPSIVKNFADECSKKKNEAKLDVAERFFVPFWFSPSSVKMRQHPLDFGGDHTSEVLYKNLGMYGTHQMFPIWNNVNLCPALASKKKFDSVGVNNAKLLIPEEGYGAKEVEYCVERGICNKVGATTTDYCRWVATYKSNNGKYNVSLLCGDMDFIGGSGAIFKSLFSHVDILKQAQENKRFNGITLPDVSVNHVVENDATKSSGIAAARLLGGAVMMHDYLCVLRDIFGVKKLVEFDVANKDEIKSVSISTVIDDYAKVKKYYVLNTALKLIR